MKASETKILDFMRKSPQFHIPIYQRTYSWTEKECKQLWDDIIRTGENDNINAHFLGSILYIEKGIYHISNHNPQLVIDGQQRLTTITILLAALAKKLETLPESSREILEGFTPKKLRNLYLLNTEEEGEKRFKLILSKNDKGSLISIIEDKQLPKNHSIRIDRNYKLFKNWIENIEDKVLSLCKGIAKLIVVDIALSRDQDNPQLIFESMNSTGKELSQADLIRNYVLMGLEVSVQTNLYEEYWRPMELDFGQETYTANFDGFMRHYLTVKTGEIPRISDVYDAFKQYTHSSDGMGIENIVKDIRQYAKYYCAMALKQEDDRELKIVLQNLKDLNVDVVYPFVLELYDDYKKSRLTKEDFIEIINLTESYVFRRSICSIPTNSLNHTFARLLKNINKEKYLEAVKANYLLLQSYRRFPLDSEFSRELKFKDMYNMPRRSYWLRRLENFNRKEKVEVEQFTIEHIMPQNEELSKEWINDLGIDWKRIHETYLHTIGNLTLTGYNSEYSDNSFQVKRDMENGFKDSPIKLNNSLRLLEVWNENEIIKRADQLSNIALQVWVSPILSKDVLDTYIIKEKPKNGYSIENYPPLDINSMSYVSSINDLYLALRKEIMSLDSLVTEEFTKYYIAYKAETNFVDVVPKTKKLSLIINMKFADINDSRGICRDMSQIASWGNGDIEVIYRSIDDLPYIMSLIKQSFEQQINIDQEN